MAEISESVSEIAGGILLALAVLVGVGVPQMTLEVWVGHGVAADGAPPTRMFELFTYRIKDCYDRKIQLLLKLQEPDIWNNSAFLYLVLDYFNVFKS